MKRVILPLLLLVSVAVNGQELQCKVSVNHSQVQGTNTQVFDALKRAAEDFMNNTRWTNLTFKQNELIDCSIGFIVKAVDGDMLTCDMQIQARRPVWGSSYVSPLLNLRDVGVTFKFQEFDALNLTPTYDQNIVAVLAYYAYIILGYDMDSFQKLGGTPYFAQAENIVNISQSRSEPESSGWRAFDKNGMRYELVSNLLDERFRKMREFLYDYHRLGLDMMTSNIGNARAKIAEGITVVQEVNRLQPQAQMIVSFADVKRDEIVNIFSKHGSEREIERVYDVMTAINPTAVEIYNRMKQK